MQISALPHDFCAVVLALDHSFPSTARPFLSCESVPIAVVDIPSLLSHSVPCLLLVSCFDISGLHKPQLTCWRVAYFLGTLHALPKPDVCVITAKFCTEALVHGTVL
jgi:hypothetical protein